MNVLPFGSRSVWQPDCIAPWWCCCCWCVFSESGAGCEDLRASGRSLDCRMSEILCEQCILQCAVFQTCTLKDVYIFRTITTWNLKTFGSFRGVLCRHIFNQITVTILKSYHFYQVKGENSHYTKSLQGLHFVLFIPLLNYSTVAISHLTVA